MKLSVNWGHASAQPLMRDSTYPDEDNMNLLTCAREVLEQREARRAFEKAPRAPIAGTSAVAMFNEKLQVDLPFCRWHYCLACDVSFLQVLPP